MSWEDFAEGFASGFVPAYNARIERNARKEERKEEREYNAKLREEEREAARELHKWKLNQEDRREKAAKDKEYNTVTDSVMDMYGLPDSVRPQVFGYVRSTGSAEGFIEAYPDGDISMTGSAPKTSVPRKEMAGKVYSAFRVAGFSDNQSRALTAEINRENSLNPTFIFGGHTDAANNASNFGMLSWQGSRRKRAKEFLTERGLLEADGSIKQSDEAIVAQAEFLRQEMENNPAYERTRREFLANRDVDPETAATVLGDNFIRWRRTDPKYSASGYERIAEGYAILGDIPQLASMGGGTQPEADPMFQQMSDMFPATQGLSLNNQGDQTSTPENTMSPDNLDMGQIVVPEVPVPEMETVTSEDTRRLEFGVGSDYEMPSLTEVTRDNARGHIADALLAGEAEAAETLRQYAEGLGVDVDVKELSGASVQELRRLRALATDPKEIALYDKAISAAEKFPVDEEDWRNISTVREGNWRAIAAKAEEAGDTDYAERVRALGEQFEEGGYSLSDQTYVITYQDENGQTRRVTAPVDENTGRFIDLSTGNEIGRDRLVGDAIPSDNVSGFLKEYARISGRVEPFQERRGALLDTMRSAQSLENLVRQNDNILTSIGGGGTRLINGLRQEFDALNALASSGATNQEIDAEINRIAQENAGILSEISDQAQLATLFNAEVLRFAFNYAKTGLGQEGVGLSNKDFDNALKIVSAGSSYDTFSKNLRSRVSEGISAVEDNRLGLSEDPAVRAVLEMPNAERWTSDLLNASTEQFVQSRGLGEMYQWSQAEPEPVEQAQSSPVDPGDTSTADSGPNMDAFNRVVNSPNNMQTIRAFETRLNAAEGYSPDQKRSLRKQMAARLGLTESQYNDVLNLNGGQ